MKTTFPAALLATLVFGLMSVHAEDGEIALTDNAGGLVKKTKTSKDGTYQFTALKPGPYILHLPGQPDRKVNVGADGKFGGRVVAPTGGVPTGKRMHKPE